MNNENKVKKSDGKEKKGTKEERKAKRAEKRAKKEAAAVAAKVQQPEGLEQAAPPPESRSDLSRLGYSNEVNPFGDQNLDKSFKWEANKRVPSKTDNDNANRIATINAAKNRREEKEREDQALRDMKSQAAIDADGMTFEEWEARGKVFELEQLVTRANNRLGEKRMRAIDILIFTTRILRQQDPPTKLADLREPSKVIASLSIADLRELQKEITTIIEYDPDNKQQWEAMLVLTKQELHEQLKGTSNTSVHDGVSGDLEQQLSTQSHEELCAAEAQATDMLRSGAANLDVGFWTAVQKRITIWKSRSFLREFFAQKCSEIGIKEQELNQPASTIRSNKVRTTLVTDDSDNDVPFSSSKKSPPLRPLSNMTNGEIDRLVGEVDDLRNILSGRSTALIKADARRDQETLMRSRGVRLGEEEELFDDTIRLQTDYDWKNKYRPRKPKYFNKIVAGYEWNRYNQTHFDADNPPPKIVTGYRFTIFYPDLVDPTKQQPTYFVQPTTKGWKDDVCILRFTAGPPYEDIAFTIVNKEWDKHWKANYKCTFERGVLTLNFQFMKYKYRR
eukprot:TRINITY_DN3181_c3_g1_i1.p1 TRINITY_DN3181_c3_g1~~TRINITY_DN3181_c3_g1_i1.p1  ORF type:complete len:562 (+),score=143.11 TRINITY_DN3181_c3_g1_i1:44-1729(+)